ncbi:MAG: hypothetical protein K2Y03_09060 [Sphingomonas sp.]|nr:hypothetical protein [Sphingomonas sp.]
MMRVMILALVALPAIAAAQVRNDDSVGRAATEPLRDTRIEKDKIPPVLLMAQSAPYSMTNTRSCAQITDQVAQLTKALGDDVDIPGKPKGEGAAVAAAATRAAVGALIPGLGVVRVITGADKAQRRAEAAVHAGTVRRSFLKGLGAARGCRAPAAPTPAALAEQPELPPADPKQ